MAKPASLVPGLLILALWAVFVTRQFWDTWALDLSAVYFAGHFFHMGDPGEIYSRAPDVFWSGKVIRFQTPPPQSWVDFAAAQGFDEARFTPYVYPPLWAAVFAPLSEFISAKSFFNTARVLSVLAILGQVVLLWRMLRPRAGSFTIWAILSTALLYLTIVARLGIELGQPQILVSFIVVLSFVALQQDRPRTSGALLALAAAMKLSPLLFAFVFILERRWKALASFFIVGAALALTSVIVAGPDLHRQFVDVVGRLNAHTLISRFNTGLRPALRLLADTIAGQTDWQAELPYFLAGKGWIRAVSTIFLLAGFIAAGRCTGTLPERTRLWARVFLVSLIGILSGPLAWTHYLLLTMLMLPGLIELTAPAIGIGWMVLFAIAFSPELFFTLVDQPWGMNAQILLDVSLLLGLVAFVLMAACRQGAPLRR